MDQSEVERVAAAPLVELLEAIPADARLVWTEPDGLKATHHVPVGRYAREAAALLRSLAADADAGRALWAHLIETRDAWGEYQDTFEELGLLEKVVISKDTPAEDRCEDCDGDCDYCYQPTNLLAIQRGAKGE
jgi:hypothetical protein